MADLVTLTALTKLTKRVQFINKKYSKDIKNGKDGKDGKDGLDGKDGKKGVAGKDGLNGKSGLDGRKGKDGSQGSDGEDGVGVVGVTQAADGDLVFLLSDGKEESVELPLDLSPNKSSGVTVFNRGGGSGGSVKYFQQTTQTAFYTEVELIEGRNVIGVTYNGNSTVNIPTTLENTKLISVKNETGQDNIITIQSE
jgi:hypothetical protein